MPRKYSWHDFRGPGYYLLTLASALRNRNIFARNDADGVHPTPLGLLAEEQWRIICEETEGLLRTDRFQLMADHIHILVQVTARPPWTIGSKIGAFKARTTSLARRRLSFPKTSPLWGSGYDWRIKETPEKLDHARRYIDGNPSQGQLKREIRSHFGAVGTLLHPRLPKIWPDAPTLEASLSWTAYGNPRLLDGKLWPLRVSRRASLQERQALLGKALSLARAGWVCLSPAISPGEKEIFHTVLSNGGRAIHLETSVLTPFYHPAIALLPPCAEGRLLVLSPFPRDYRRRPLDRQMAEHLNACARAIAAHR